MLQNAAKRHSEDMALRDFVSHENPDGATFVDRVVAEEYPVAALAENIAAGYRRRRAWSTPGWPPRATA